MQLRPWRAWIVESILTLLVLLGSPAAFGQTATHTSPALNVRTVLEQGQALENQRRWGEALSLYEESLRELPHEQDLESRFRSAKIHYDLGRRYHDGSFRRSLTGLTEADALALYAEVLLKLQSHYVDEPDWRKLVDHGTATLSTALADDVFLNQHLREVSPAEVAAFRKDLEGRLRTFPVRSRHEARDAVTWAGRFSRERLGLNSTAVVMEYVCGASNLLDDYSSYLTKDQLNEVYSQIEGNFVGLGIELKATDGALQILRVIPGSPADRGGLRPLDQIVAVDGQSTASFNTDQAANLLQGKEGSLVDVAVITPGQPQRQLRLRREHVEVPSVDDVKMVDQAFGIAYLRLTCFQKTTSKDLDAALWKLHRLGMKSLIMDLRGNPGGLLSSSVEVVDKFVTNGTIVSTRGRSPQEDYTYTAHAAGTWRVPLVVLIDGDSASASEIFAGAIRDHARGTIVGTKSYGKGSVQGIFPLAGSGSGIRLTTAKFYSPNGLAFSKVGVDPHVKVRQTAKLVSTAVGEAAQAEPEDAILAAGMQVARQQMARR